MQLVLLISYKYYTVKAASPASRPVSNQHEEDIGSGSGALGCGSHLFKYILLIIQLQNILATAIYAQFTMTKKSLKNQGAKMLHNLTFPFPSIQPPHPPAQPEMTNFIKQWQQVVTVASGQRGRATFSTCLRVLQKPETQIACSMNCYSPSLALS